MEQFLNPEAGPTVKDDAAPKKEEEKASDAAKEVPPATTEKSEPEAPAENGRRRLQVEEVKEAPPAAET